MLDLDLQKTSGGPFQPNDPKVLESDYSNHYYSPLPLDKSKANVQDKVGG